MICYMVRWLNVKKTCFAFIASVIHSLTCISAWTHDNEGQSQKRAKSLLSIYIFKWNYTLCILQEKRAFTHWEILSQGTSTHMYLNEVAEYNSQRFNICCVGIDELFKKTPRIRNVPCPKSSPIMKQGCFQNVTAVH